MSEVPAGPRVPASVAGGTMPSCPFIGCHDDAAIADTVPSGEHRCYKPPTPHGVRRDIQNRFCLTARYQRCPVYRGMLATPPGPSWTDRLFGDGGLSARLLSREGLAFVLFAMLVPAVIGVIFAVVSDGEDSPPSLRSATDLNPAISAPPSDLPKQADGSGIEEAEAGPDVTLDSAQPATPPTGLDSQEEEVRPIAPDPDRTPREQLLSWENLTEHRVGPGDNLGAIALEYGTTVEAVALYNGLSDVDAIDIGQVLTVPIGFTLPIELSQTGAGAEQIREESPPGEGAEPPQNGEDPPAVPAAPESLLAWTDIVEWEVSPGDTLFLIASDFDTTFEAIAALNRIDPGAPLQVGTVLRVPRGFLEPIG